MKDAYSFDLSDDDATFSYNKFFYLTLELLKDWDYLQFLWLRILDPLEATCLMNL